MAELIFYKWQGLGNDFVLVAGGPEGDNGNLVRRLCARRWGVGADGVVYLVRCPRELKMRIFNSDGSEAAMCGNGLRCAAAQALRWGWIGEGEEVPFTTLAGPKRATVWGQGPSFKVQVEMGAAAGVEEVYLPPESPGRRGMAVNLGNPHLVVEVKEWPQLASWGPRLEEWGGGANVEFMRPLDRKRVEMKVWEHGVGETLACGTGACATWIAARRWGLVEERVTVQLPGGELQIGGSEEALAMEGEARYVFSGRWPLP